MEKSNWHQFSVRTLLAIVLLCAVVFLAWRILPSVGARLNVMLVALFAFAAAMALQSKPSGEYSVHRRRIAWWMCLCAALPLTLVVLVSIANGVLFYVFQRNSGTMHLALVLSAIATSILGFFVCLAVSLQAYTFRRDDVQMTVFQIVTLATSIAFPLEAVVVFVAS